MNPVNGYIGRSAGAEYAYAAVHGTARTVLTTSRLAPQGHPGIWFSQEFTAEEQAALDALPWSMVDLQFAAATISLDYAIKRAEPLRLDHPDRATLVGAYERLLDGLSSTPIDVQ